jgi:opacity protein-like surface antigen
MKLCLRVCGLITGAFLCVPVAGAQSSEWQRTMLFYMIGASLDGDTQIGSTETDVHESFSDILDNLDLGAMGSFQARRGEWAHTVDVIYTSLSQDGSTPSYTFKAEVDQLIASYDIAYALNERFEVLGGARYNSIDLDLTVRSAAGSANGRGSKDWIDPYIGFSANFPLGDKWSLILRGDIGGFDVGSKLAWQAVARVNWNFSDSFFATFGYRILDTDYEDGSGSSFFKYDVALSGPGIGIGWRF